MILTRPSQFGNPSEDFEVLKGMAAKLPRSSFQKLGLAAAGLSTAFSSLTASLSTMRTEGGATPMTLRNVKHEPQSPSAADAPARVDLIQHGRGWHTYHLGSTIRAKVRFDHLRRKFVDVPFYAGATGVAILMYKFASGVERCVFRCTEITGSGIGMRATGEWLVAKESLYHEQLLNAEFHETMAKVLTTGD